MEKLLVMKVIVLRNLKPYSYSIILEKLYNSIPVL